MVWTPPADSSFPSGNHVKHDDLGNIRSPPSPEPGSFMRNHEIRERHESEVSCGSASQDIARRVMAVTWDQNARLFFTFVSVVPLTFWICAAREEFPDVETESVPGQEDKADRKIEDRKMRQDDDRDRGVIFLSPMFLSTSFGSGRGPGWVFRGE